MTELDKDLIEAVTELLKELGKEVTMNIVTSVYSVATGVDTGTTSQVTVKITPPEVKVVENDDRTTKSVWTFYSGPLESEPPDGTWFSIDEKRIVVTASPIYSGEEICLWKFVGSWASTTTSS